MTVAPALPFERADEGTEEKTDLEVIVERVRLHAKRRLLFLEHQKGAAALGSLGASEALRSTLNSTDEPSLERKWQETDPDAAPLNERIQRLEAALADADTPLARLCESFGLGRAERDVVEVCLATALDPSLNRIWALLQNHPSHDYVSEHLVGRLCGHGRVPLLGRGDGLLRWRIVQTAEAAPGDPVPLKLDPTIVEYLCGQLMVEPTLVDRVVPLGEREALPFWAVEEIAGNLSEHLQRGHAVRVLLTGPKRSGRRSLAACITSALGGATLSVDASGLEPSEFSEFHLRVQRLALLSGASVVWTGCPADRVGSLGPGEVRLQFFVLDAGTPVPRPSADTVIEHVAMPRLSVEERSRLWKRLVPTSVTWSAEDFAQVTERYQVQLGDIVEIGNKGVTTAQDAAHECRRLTRDHLGELGTLIDCPFNREDLVLPPKLNKLLDEFIFEGRDRARFWGQPNTARLFPRGTSLVGLMTGPPGTGKTMTAQIVAAELGLDLIRVDLASAVSKYIGETSKNLRKIFVRAQEMNAVLLFDEADALFSKRTEVRDSHDKHANSDTNYLLQLLEDHDGIALLASNKRSNIDTAFLRRIRFVMEFPRPERAERQAIWTRLVSELSAERARDLAPVLATLAETLDSSGAQIKASLLGALFLARQSGQELGVAHLHRSIEREKLKEGRALTPRESERILRHA